MKLFNFITLTCSLAIFTTLMANTITGIGYGDTKEISKKEALADLSQNIKSDVYSSFESSIQVDGVTATSNSNSNIKITSNLPILGAKFQVLTKKTEVQTKAILLSQNSAPLYLNKLQGLSQEIDKLLKNFRTADTNQLKLKLYEEIFSLLNEYDRYNSVAVILGVNPKQKPSITKTEVEIALEKLSANIESLDMATSILANEFNDEKIYLYPPLLQHTTVTSEFSAVFLKTLSPKLKIVATPKDAQYLLIGEYTIIKNALVLNYQLLDVKTNDVKKSKTLTLNESIYNGIVIKPKTIDFDTLLNSGFASSSTLKVSLNSNRGSENLLFNDGEDVELFVKLNKMGYIYIVGYTQTPNAKFSYMLELQEGRGDSKFVKFINADDASRWMSLGQFSVEEPFGVESLQVIASNQKITKLPLNIYDEDTGYYIISKDLQKALSQTRGLKRKNTKSEFSEATMSFTTIK